MVTCTPECRLAEEQPGAVASDAGDAVDASEALWTAGL
jgi:hypothetical protein